MHLDRDAWRAVFRGFGRSAFRLETHQVYTMPGEQEDFERFLAGGEKVPDGTQTGRELVEDPDLGRYRQWRDTALDLGVPFTEWHARA